jgi:hypothetical protein
MEWLQTLVWIFRGGEKSLIAFVAVVCLLSFWVPLEPATNSRMDAVSDVREGDQ